MSHKSATPQDMNERKSNLQDSANDLVDQAKHTASELPKAMADMKASVGLVADQVKETAREQLDVAKDYANDVAERGRAALHSLEGKVSERPLGYALAAGALGLLVGLGFRAASRRS